METVLSIYGAVLATIVALVGIWSKRTRLRLRVNPGRGVVDARGDGGGGAYGVEGDVIYMKITNKSEHPVKVTMIGGHEVRQLLRRLIFRPSRGFVVLYPLPAFVQFPFTIPARDAVTIWFKRDAAEVDRLTVFSAYTADDRTARTRPLRISRRPSMEVHTPTSS